MTADDLTPEARRELEAIDAALAGEPVAPQLTELGALALSLREQRPAPRPGFARDLDARAAAGFVRRRRLSVLRGRLAALPNLAVASAVTAVLVIGVALVGFYSGSSTYDGASGGGGSVADGTAGGTGDEAVARQEAGGADEAAGGAAEGSAAAAPDADSTGRRSAAAGPTSAAARPQAPSPGSAAAPAPGTTAPSTGSPRSDGRRRRLVERSASIVLAAPPRQVDDVAGRIMAVADRIGGLVLSSSVTATDGRDTEGGGDFLLRVPAARLPDALAQLSRIAHVRERRQTVDDITRQGVSARGRLAEARAERRSLLRRLAAAATDNEAAAVKARLRDVDRRIADARTDLSRVHDRARYATVSVTLVGDRRTGAVGGRNRDDGTAWGPAEAVRDALRVLEVAAGVLLIALAVAIPLSLLVAVGVAVARLAARRERERALDAV